MKDFLTLPSRPSKPRKNGRTHVIDNGQGAGEIGDACSQAGDLIDLVKLGWGTSVVTKNVERKIGLYRDHGIDVCLGGTLFELCLLQGKVDAYRERLREWGIETVEISDGVIKLSRERKADLIASFANEGFTVISEVGSKDVDAVTTPAKWVAEIVSELAAGASFVVLEGRESGTAGIYRPTGEVRMGLVDEVLDAGIEPAKLIFEAPRKSQQVWFISQLGANVNLGNIALSDVIGVETLRLGLRGDTLRQLHAPPDL